MTTGRVYIEGRLHLSVEIVAELYRVQAVWLLEACRVSAVRSVPWEEGSLTIAADDLDRVARVVWLSHVLGLDLETIAWRYESFGL